MALLIGELGGEVVADLEHLLELLPAAIQGAGDAGNGEEQDRHRQGEAEGPEAEGPDDVVLHVEGAQQQQPGYDQRRRREGVQYLADSYLLRDFHRSPSGAMSPNRNRIPDVPGTYPEAYRSA